MATKIKLGVLGSTNGTDLQAIIDAIEKKELDAEIVLVVSDKEGSGILERARKHGIETFSVNYERFNSRSDAEAVMVIELKRREVELVLLIGFMKILTPYFVNEFRGRIWNIHPSLLPKYAGGKDLDVHAQVIRNHEKETGCTLHEVVETLDGGKILMQKKCEVIDGETPETLKAKVQKLEQDCFLEAIRMVSEGELIIG
jgi:formyltetrahydrofolate-dependent phosphoribosylglycinamide formyltransferase